MRPPIVLLALTALACSSAPEPPTPARRLASAESATLPATPAAPPSAIPTTRPGLGAGPTRPSPELAHQVAQRVREGRRAAHGGHFAEALTAFDSALALIPVQPRVLCESGFVAHRAGDHADAARRIERALHAFGPPTHVSRTFRAPLAMCLYNRGLVAEAQHQAALAAEAFAASLALRPNEVVRAALERASAGAEVGMEAGHGEDDDALHIAGARVQADVVQVDSPEALMRVLAEGLRGTEDDESTPVAAAGVTLRETMHASGGGRELLVLEVNSADAHYPVSSLVIAERIRAGYRVGAFEIGAVDLMVSGTEGDVRLLLTETRWEGDVAIVRFTRSTDLGSWDSFDGEDGGSCWEARTHSVAETFEIYCVPDATCVSMPTAYEDSGESVHRECVAYDGDEGDGDGSDEDRVETDEEGVASEDALRVRLDAHAFVAEGEPSDHLPSPGRGTLDELDPLEPPAWMTP